MNDLEQTRDSCDINLLHCVLIFVLLKDSWKRKLANHVALSDGLKRVKWNQIEEAFNGSVTYEFVCEVLDFWEVRRNR